MPNPLTYLQDEAELERLHREDCERHPDTTDYSEPEYLPPERYSDLELEAALDRQWDEDFAESERQQERP